MLNGDCRLSFEVSRDKCHIADIAVGHSARRFLHIHTHPFNGPLSGTTRSSRYQKVTTNLNFTEARDSEWQWHQLGRMQVCTLHQTENHASTPPGGQFFTGRVSFLPPNQQHLSTESRYTGRAKKDAKFKSPNEISPECS